MGSLKGAKKGSEFEIGMVEKSEEDIREYLRLRKSRLSIASGLSTPFDCDDLEVIAKKLEDAAYTSKHTRAEESTSNESLSSNLPEESSDETLPSSISQTPERQKLSAKALWIIISEDRILKILFVIIILMSGLALGGLSFVGIGAARSMLK